MIKSHLKCETDNHIKCELLNMRGLCRHNKPYTYSYSNPIFNLHCCHRKYCNEGGIIQNEIICLAK